jgi:tetratricopeptide (TPR) repeat protein
MSAFRLLIVASFVCLSQQAASATDYLVNLGERYYKSGDYANAAESLRSAIRKTPQNAYAHYMLGNTLLLLHKASEAEEEYKFSAQLDPNGQIGKYSKQAISKISQPAVPPPGLKASAGSTAGSQMGSIKSVDTSNGNFDEYTRRMTDECDSRVHDINRETEDKIRSLEQEKLDRISANGDKTYRPLTVGYGPYGPIQQMVPYYDPSASNDVINREYALKQDTVRSDADRKIADLRKFYADKIAAGKSR